ncbi:helix-turn-helix domain-containing protein [Paramicrobacterium chengjingii]|uniref:helix-turn-helix domain-containing protein n=1 Tax=Paramicrobacterium chengjingii TaxID=2769067 RepID=UPI00141FE6F5|nr:helix-turn-helix transcriptional regulator [Microbacterium chengjingii]
MDNDSPDAFDLLLGQILTEYKDASGLSFTTLAQQTGLGRATIVRIMAGERTARVDYLRAIASVLGTEAGDVIEEAERRESAR